jgi:hypothetical protein
MDYAPYMEFDIAEHKAMVQVTVKEAIFLILEEVCLYQKRYLPFVSVLFSAFVFAFAWSIPFVMHSRGKG